MWRKLTKQPLIVSEAPTSFDALYSIRYNPTTNTMYMMTNKREWSIYPLGSIEAEADAQGDITLTSDIILGCELETVIAGDITLTSDMTSIYEET